MRWSKFLAILGLISGMVFWFIAPRLVGWVFGDAWTPASTYIQYLGLMGSASVLGSALQGTWQVYQSALATLVWDVSRLGALWVVVWLAATQHAGAERAVAYVSLAGTLAYGLGWIHCWVTVRSRHRPQDHIGALDEPR